MRKIAFKTQGLVAAGLIWFGWLAFAQEAWNQNQGQTQEEEGSAFLQSGNLLPGMTVLQGAGPLQGASPLLNAGPVRGAAPLSVSTPPVFVRPQLPNAAPPLILLASLPLSSLTTTLIALPAPPVTAILPPQTGAPQTSDGGPASTSTAVPLASPGTSYIAPATPTPVVSPQNVCTTASCT